MRLNLRRDSGTWASRADRGVRPTFLRLTVELKHTHQSSPDFYFEMGLF